MTPKQLGSRLREARKLKGLTQEEVAERMGGTRFFTDISEFENGKRKLPAVEIPTYARALDVPILYFFEDVLIENDLDSAILEWFHRLPDVESKRRVFRFIQDVAPHILGQDG